MANERRIEVDSLNRWLTLLANIAVFASIMFLAIEIRQNQVSIEEANRLSVLEARTLEVEQFNDFRALIVGSSELSRIWFDGMDDAELAEIDEQKFLTLCNSLIWISASSYERSRVLERPDAMQATTAIRAGMIDNSRRFRACWLNFRDILRAYGVGDYVDDVERQVTTELQ